MMVSEGQKLGAITLLAVCLFYYAFLLATRQPSPETPPEWGRREPGSLTFEVRGSRADGIYSIPRKMGLSEVAQMIGLPDRAEGQAGLTGPIADGALLLVSPHGEVTPAEIDAAGRLALGLRIDLNRASAEDLVRVPGIGERMAVRIIALRQEKEAFSDLAELMAIPGIKEKKLRALADHLMVGRTP